MIPEQAFSHWITERHNVYLRRAAGKPQGRWTTDPILAQYRFCNVYRQLDRVTVWLNTEWAPDIPEEYLLFWTCVARLLNHAEPLTAVRPARWDRYSPADFVAALNKIKLAGGTMRNSAYIVSTNGHKMPFPEYIGLRVLPTVWEKRDLLDDVTTLHDAHKRLTAINGFGSFMSGQVLADLKYWHTNLMSSPDWESFVVPGPGSKRGLNRLLGYEPNDAMSDRAFAAQFPYAFKLATHTVQRQKFPRIHAQDVQNCLCEFDKYERARLNQGRPKQNFTPYKMG